MVELNTLERKGTNAVKKLRDQKLRNGQPFMINSKELPSNQCYLEYPNGSIKLVTIIKNARDFDVIYELTPLQSQNLRLKFNLVR